MKILLQKSADNKTWEDDKIFEFASEQDYDENVGIILDYLLTNGHIEKYYYHKLIRIE